MRVSLIVAAAENDTIGRNNALPWHLPQDLKYFRRITMGKPIVMGRKTYESIGKPLPGRTNIVVTGNTTWQADGVVVTHSVADALSRAEDVALIDMADEVLVIGGATIYEAVLPVADRLYLTRVHADIEGDAHLPAIDWSAWDEQGRERFAADGPNPYDYSFIVFDRRAGQVA